MRLLDYDYIIVGQGLAGSVLSFMLINEGKKVLVIDNFNPNASSQVAAGLVNPVTGRRVVKSWMADSLLPFAKKFYDEAESVLGEKFFFPIDVLEVIHSVKELNEWTTRMAEDDMKHYISHPAPEEVYRGKIREFLQMFRISSSAWMNIPQFIELCRKQLIEHSALLDEVFDYSRLNTGDVIEYGIIKGSKIIFCEGYKSLQNPLWSWIPLVPAKGEILTIQCYDLPEEFILLSGIFLIPMGNKKFRAGSTYEWNFPHELPTDEGKLKLLKLLDEFLKLPYSVIDHRAGVRPTVKDRRPLIGSHPEHENVFLFNGMGTKGVQLIPYFADHFVGVLEKGKTLSGEVDVRRFFGK